VIADGVVVTTPTARPWVLWTVAPGYEEDRSQMHGYEATKEAALEAFARSWNRQS
jgi:hypothetical protein